MKKILLAIVMVLALALPGWAAAEVHYVTYAGAGGKDGSSWANAFSQADLENAAKWDANANTDNNVIGPGDTVALSGTFSDNSITIPGSGTANNPIIIDGDYENTGTKAILGDAVAVPNSWSDTGGNIWTQALTHDPKRIWIGGTEKARNSNATVTANYPWYWASNVLYIYSVGSPGTSVTETINMNGFYASGKDYITIKNVDIRYTRAYALRIDGCAGWIIENSNIGYNSSGMGVYVNNSGATGSTNGTIRNCTIDSNCQLTLNYNADSIFCEDGVLLRDGATGWAIYNNTIKNWCHSNIYCYAIGSYDLKNNSIYNNTITSPNVSYSRAFILLSTRSGSTGNKIYNNYMYNHPIANQCHCPGTEVYNNVISTVTGDPNNSYANGQGIAIQAEDGTGTYQYYAQNMKFYNNVIYNCAGVGISLYTDGGTTNDITGNEIKNNIIVNCGLQNSGDYQYKSLAIYNQSDINNNTFSNNCLYSSETEDVVYYRGNVYNITEFNAGDAESDTVANNINGDPLFINPGGSTATDYKLQATSPCIGAGTATGQPSTTDFAGQPWRNPPSMGAYQFPYKVSEQQWWRK